QIPLWHALTRAFSHNQLLPTCEAEVTGGGDKPRVGAMNFPSDLRTFRSDLLQLIIDDLIRDEDIANLDILLGDPARAAHQHHIARFPATDRVTRRSSSLDSPHP